MRQAIPRNANVKSLRKMVEANQDDKDETFNETDLGKNGCAQPKVHLERLVQSRPFCAIRG